MSALTKFFARRGARKADVEEKRRRADEVGARLENSVRQNRRESYALQMSLTQDALDLMAQAKGRR